jgi:hypothetical protein
MTMRLSEQGGRKIDAFWANTVGCLPEDFYEAGMEVSERQASDAAYAHVFQRLGRVQVDCSPSLYGDVRIAVRGREPAEVFALEWGSFFSSGLQRLETP